MLVLGIEGTAHTFALSLLDASQKKVLFHHKAQFKDEDSGMDLRKLSEFHLSSLSVLLEALNGYLSEHGLSYSSIDLIGFSRGPGIGNSLKIAGLLAKTLALRHKIKIVGVNHIRAHLEIAKMFTAFEDPLFLYVSGVNTQIVTTNEFGLYRIYGETEDIGFGNLLDTSARELGLGFPGGPLLEEHAKKGNNLIALPFTLKGMNASFAGISSFLKQCLEKIERREKLLLLNGEYKYYKEKEEFICDFAYSLQETFFALLLELAERGLAYTKKKEFLIVGGVGANKRIQEMALEMCKERGVEFSTYPLQYALDNAAMIAWEAYLQKEKGSFSIANLKALPYINLESEL